MPALARLVPLAIFAKSTSESIPSTGDAVVAWGGAVPEPAGTPQVAVGISLDIYVLEGTSGLDVLMGPVLLTVAAGLVRYV